MYSCSGRKDRFCIEQIIAHLRYYLEKVVVHWKCHDLWFWIVNLIAALIFSRWFDPMSLVSLFLICKVLVS
jgi:hypothetical protein